MPSKVPAAVERAFSSQIMIEQENSKRSSETSSFSVRIRQTSVCAFSDDRVESREAAEGARGPRSGLCSGPSE